MCKLNLAIGILYIVVNNQETTIVRESTFIEKNEEDWKKLEALLKKPEKDADLLLKLFEKVSGDLAYARTYYPNRSIRVYLNNLTQQVLNSIRKKQSKFQLNDIFHFYKHTLPHIIYKSRYYFYTSFLTFLIAVIIGAVSAANVPDFCNVVLGDEYVELTEDNINSGDPMAIYKKDDKGSMFMRITLNNIRVSFFCFALGVIGGVGTIIILLLNGIMLGAFQYYFYSKGLFLTSFLTIWIHGTIEISAIILAGAAGLILGAGLVAPKSYERNTSLILSAKKSLKIILAIIPLFIIAGFLESFVTRLTEMPMIVKILIIGSSLFFIILVFAIYPFICARRGFVESEYEEIEPTLIESIENAKYQHKPLAGVLSSSFAELRIGFGAFLLQFLLPATLVYAGGLFFMIKFRLMTEVGISPGFSFASFKYFSWPYWIMLVSLVTWFFVFMMMQSNRSPMDLNSKLKNIKNYFLKVLPFAIVFVLGYFVSGKSNLIFLIIPLHFIFICFETLSTDRGLSLGQVAINFKFSFTRWLDFIMISLLMIFISFLIKLLSITGVVSLIVKFFSWHDFLEIIWLISFLFRK